MLSLMAGKPGRSGRRTSYTPQIAATICERLANGESLRSICRDEDMPAPVTVMSWYMSQPDFAEAYTRARERQADTYADEIISLADECRVGEKTEETIDGKGVSTTKTITADMVERTRLQIESRKWFAARVAPKKYGDRVTQEISGPDGGSIQTRVTVEFVEPPKAADG